MAKFGHYFGLCPLIHHRSLLGISKDSENGNVIVTLGKNMAMKYGVVDQNQITSWTTKEKFTSPVIFDSKTQKYVAVFNNLFIRCWESDNSNLDRVKKFKFKSNIDTVLVINNTSFVIFEAGDIVTLEYALANHKTLMAEQILDKNEEYIMDKICCYSKAEKYIGLLVGNFNSNRVSHLLWTGFDSVGNRLQYSRFTLGRSACELLVGCCFHLSDQQIQILTLWSDGKLYVKSVEDNSVELGEMFCVIESIACTDPVSMVSLDEDYLAIYGGNSNQEGALLIIYNMEFKCIQCTQSFKLQTIGAKLCKIQEKLFVPVGQNLAVVPFHLRKAQLSALIENYSANIYDGVVHNVEELCWTGYKNIGKTKDEKDLIIKDSLDRGCPESIIFQDLLPVFIESTNLRDLKFLIRDCKVIAEDCHAKVLRYILELPRQSFRKSKLVPSEHYQEDLQPLERYEILKLVLEKPLVEKSNGAFWRLEVSTILKLLNFILYSLKYDQNITDIHFYIRLVEWANFIFSANFQTFFFSKEEKIVEVLSALKEFIDPMCSFSSYTECLCFVEQILKKKKVTKIAASEYKIEKIDL